MPRLHRVIHVLARGKAIGLAGHGKGDSTHWPFVINTYIQCFMCLPLPKSFHPCSPVGRPAAATPARCGN